MLETAVRGAVRFPRAVLEFLGDAFAARDRRDAGEYAATGLPIAIGRLEGRLERLLDWKLTNAANRKLANHLRKHQDELLTFLSKPWVEATSWPADLAIRGAVANRKVFGGNRDGTGARALERILSVLATCAKRGVDAFSYVTRVLTAPADQRDLLALRLLKLPAPS
jgi:transposase